MKGVTAWKSYYLLLTTYYLLLTTYYLLLTTYYLLLTTYYLLLTTYYLLLTTDYLLLTTYYLLLTTYYLLCVAWSRQATNASVLARFDEIFKYGATVRELDIWCWCGPNSLDPSKSSSCMQYYWPARFRGGVGLLYVWDTLGQWCH